MHKHLTKHKRYHCLAVGIGLLVIIAPGGCKISAASESIDIVRRVTARFEECRLRVENVDVTFDVAVTALDKKHEMQQGTVIRQRVATTGKTTLLETTHSNEILPGSVDLNHTKCFLSTTKGQFQIFDVNGRSCRILTKQIPRIWGDAVDPLFSQCVGWWPQLEDLNSLTSGFERPVPLLGKGALYALLPERNQVDGAWCHVLDSPGIERLWIDVKNETLVRRRRIWFPDASYAEYQMRDFEQARESWLWYPTHIRRTIYEAARRDSDAILSDVECIVREFKVNALNGAWDSFDVPKGTILIKEDDRLNATQLAGGLDYLDAVTSFVLRRCSALNALPKVNSIHRPKRLFSTMWSAFAIGATVIFAIALRKKIQSTC
jgi:hypothetical protein